MKQLIRLEDFFKLPENVDRLPHMAFEVFQKKTNQLKSYVDSCEISGTFVEEDFDYFYSEVQKAYRDLAGFLLLKAERQGTEKDPIRAVNGELYIIVQKEEKK